MVRFNRKLLSILLILTALLSLLTFSVSAMSASEAVESIKKNNNDIICIAHRGDWHNFPENSLEAINAVRFADVVSIDLKVTSDKQIVLMADDTVDRMCTDAQGKAVSGKVSSFSYGELMQFFLRQGNGSSDKNKTDSKIPTFAKVLGLVGEDCAIMLNVELNDFDTVYKEVEKLNAKGNVIFRLNAKNKDILAKVQSVNFDVAFTGNYQGNIVFNATKTAKDCFGYNINTVEMGSKNGHGVLYDNFLMKRFSGDRRAMVSMVNGRCGKRTDNEIGWDDLISRGYSVIETDYPTELTEYIRTLNNAKHQLSSCYDLYENTDLKPYTSDTEKAFTDALAQAKTELSSVSSKSDCDNARNALQTSHDSLKVGEKKAVTLSFKPTAGRIITVVLCLAAFVASQIYLYKKRSKKNEVD